MQNMAFVLLIKLLLVLLTVLGVTYMWQAVAIDVAADRADRAQFRPYPGH